MDSVYQNAEIDEPVYGNIENGVPKVNITPKPEPVRAHENFETRKKQRRNRNPRNPIVSHSPDDMYSLYNQSQPGYHEPSSQKDNSLENSKRFTRRNILISIVVTCLVVVLVIVAVVVIPKNTAETSTSASVDKTSDITKNLREVTTQSDTEERNDLHLPPLPPHPLTLPPPPPVIGQDILPPPPPRKPDILPPPPPRTGSDLSNQGVYGDEPKEITVKHGNIICTIKSGNVDDEDEEIGFKSSAEQCFRSVRKKRKNANGMTWEKKTHRCYAEFKANRIVKECLSCQSCIFEEQPVVFTEHRNKFANSKKDCTDKDRNCVKWSKAGECYKNPNYMMEYCKKACQQC